MGEAPGPPVDLHRSTEECSTAIDLIDEFYEPEEASDEPIARLATRLRDGLANPEQMETPTPIAR
ncbi:hypothetical protein ACYJ1Y_16030 [Natrialbaceae archaeon A-gly3]